MTPPPPSRAFLAAQIRWVRGRGIPAQEAEDLVFDAYHKACEGFDPKRGAFEAYMQSVVRSMAAYWWRRHGHQLMLEDMVSLLEAEPEVIVIGTGVYGRMLPAPGLEQALSERGIELVMVPTGEAISRFNDLHASRRTGGGFHLTC